MDAINSPDLTILNQKENLIIVDKVNVSEDEYKKFIPIDYYCGKLVTRDCFLIYNKNCEDSNQKVNVHQVDKLTYLMLYIGFSIGRGIKIYVFSKEENNFSKIKSEYLKVLEFSYFTVTMDNLYKDVKSENKLAKLFNAKSNSSQENAKNPNTSINDNFELNINNTKVLSNLIDGIRKNLLNCPPKNFTNLVNIIYNFSQTNIINIKKKAKNITEDELAFTIFKELVNLRYFGGEQFRKLLLDNEFIKFLPNLKEIEQFVQPQNLTVNMDYLKGIYPLETSNKEKSHSDKEFQISEEHTKQYIELVSKSIHIGYFIKNILIKIFETLNIMNLEKFPNNIIKFRNYVFSLLFNNNDLKLIAKNIIFMDFEKLINVLGDGIVYELLTKNLILVSEKKKIIYNLKNIEIEKYRLNNN
jgi:hypothetical protein